ncbi:MAG: ankyrin repeat domain-containing protein [Thiobacillus sp.]|nr:ankyrin repeat domain-containing protein [Thiobacillus sp.]
MNRCVTSRFYTFVLVILWIAGVVVGPSAYADQLADSLLASAIVRLDARGVEISIKRGANVKAALRHPDAPSVTRYPVELALNALADRDDPTAANKAEKILRLLFAKGATLRGRPDELFTVVADGHERILKLLLEQGANPHVRLYGYLPSELAIKYQQEHLLPILLARGLPKVSPEEVIQIRFVDAASRQDKAGMERTLEEGAAVNGIDAAGNLALVEYLSVPLTTAEDYENLMWLLAQGADPSKGELNEEQTSPLHRLIERSYRKADFEFTAKLTALFLEKGAEVSAEDYRGMTPLHYTAEKGNVPVANVLLANNAKCASRDKLGRSPYDLAKSGDMIALLRSCK